MKKHHTLIFSKNIPNQNIIDRLIANMLKSIKIILLMDYKDGWIDVYLFINKSIPKRRTIKVRLYKLLNKRDATCCRTART